MENQPLDTDNTPQAIEIATKRRPGRPALDPSEKARRQGEQKSRYAKRNESRRRALTILQERHEDEFNSILAELNSQV